MPSPHDDAMSDSLAVLLDRAIQRRSDILLEGATMPARAILARGVHARSLHASGRLVVSIRVHRTEHAVRWRSVLSGDVSELLALSGTRWMPEPETVGTIHLEGLAEIAPGEQAALAEILLERRRAPAGDRGPRLIGGIGARSTGLGAELREAAAEVYVPLDAAAEWERLAIEWALEDPPAVTSRARLEWL